MTLQPTTLKDPAIKANLDRLLQVAEERGVEASVKQFRKMFSESQPTEEQLAEFQSRAAARARWKPSRHKTKLSKAG